jgi:2-(1,2-epoxy-1,2-dihydrophenyl)acetyl-CoA isomerase
LTGDYVLAAESAKFTMAYTAASLTPDGSSSWFVPRLIGLRKAQELMLTNRTLTAREACEWGLITKMVTDDSLQNEAPAIARQLASGPLQAESVIKKLLLITLGNGLEEQMEIEGREIACVYRKAEAKLRLTPAKVHLKVSAESNSFVIVLG